VIMRRRIGDAEADHDLVEKFWLGKLSPESAPDKRRPRTPARRCRRSARRLPERTVAAPSQLVTARATSRCAAIAKQVYASPAAGPAPAPCPARAWSAGPKGSPVGDSGRVCVYSIERNMNQAVRPAKGQAARRVWSFDAADSPSVSIRPLAPCLGRISWRTSAAFTSIRLDREALYDADSRPRGPPDGLGAAIGGRARESRRRSQRWR
jgi:hypothetical protein